MDKVLQIHPLYNISQIHSMKVYFPYMLQKLAIVAASFSLFRAVKSFCYVFQIQHQSSGFLVLVSKDKLN